MSFLLRYLSCFRNRPKRPNGPNGVQSVPRWLLLKLGAGRFVDDAAESAHSTGPRAERRTRDSRAIEGGRRFHLGLCARAYAVRRAAGD